MNLRKLIQGEVLSRRLTEIQRTTVHQNVIKTFQS